jgi:hypothetical protein
MFHKWNRATPVTDTEGVPNHEGFDMKCFGFHSKKASDWVKANSVQRYQCSDALKGRGGKGFRHKPISHSLILKLVRSPKFVAVGYKVFSSLLRASNWHC